MTRKERLKKRNKKIFERYQELKAEQKYTNDYIFKVLTEEFYLSRGRLENIIWSRDF